jgi:hypothetical protein
VYQPQSVLLKSCERSYIIDKYAIIIIVIVATLYFSIACVWAGVFYLKQLKEEENGIVNHAYQKDPVIYSEYYVGTNPFEHANRK